MTRKQHETGPRFAWTQLPSYKMWRASMEIRLGSDPAQLIRSTVGSQVRHYATSPVLRHPDALAACEKRLSFGLEYHWWRFCEQRFRPLDDVVRCLQKGYCATGRIRVNVLREVVLTEGMCRRDPVATSEFFSDYGNVVSSAAYRTGGPQARQELASL